MSLSMVIERTSSDISALIALRTKIKNRTATPSEWTQWLNNSKGAYNSADLNRVGDAIDYLANLLNGYGYLVSVTPKTDWVKSDTPREAQMFTYLNDLTAIKAKFYGTTPLPSTMDDLTYTDANNIEKLLLEIEEYINRMISGFRKCGTFKSGQGVILP